MFSASNKIIGFFNDNNDVKIKVENYCNFLYKFILRDANHSKESSLMQWSFHILQADYWSLREKKSVSKHQINTMAAIPQAINLA